MTFLFKIDDTLKRIIEHTTKHKDTCSLAYSGGKEKDPDSVYLVKDRGVYLMACTQPPLLDKHVVTEDGYTFRQQPNGNWGDGDMDWGTFEEMEASLRSQGIGFKVHEPHVVAYADSHGPDTYLGGDDFAENIPAEWFRNAIDAGKPHIVLTLTDTEIKATT